mgnify:CR=1 FL=1
MRSLVATLVLLSVLGASCKENKEKEDTQHTIEARRTKKQGSIMIVILHTNKKADTLCLLPTEIISNSRYDSVIAWKERNKSNYNPSFVNMLLKPSNHIFTFSKNTSRGMTHHLFDIEVNESWYDNGYNLGFGSALDIDSNGHGCYHISDDSKNKLFDIIFTPFFAKLLQALKNE